MPPASPVVVLGLGLPLLVALGVVTYETGANIYQSDAARAGTDYATGTGTPISAAMLGLHCAVFPATIGLAILYLFYLVKSQIAPMLKGALLLTLFSLDIAVISLSAKAPVFTKCNLLGCTYASPSLEGKTFGGTDEYSDDYNMPASYVNSLSVIYFFTALLALPVLVHQLIAFVLDVAGGRRGAKVGAATTTAVAVANPLVQSGDDIPAPLAVRAEPVSQSYAHIQEQQARKRWLGVLLGLGLFIPIVIVLTTRLGNNFQWWFPYEIAQWAAREIVPENNIGFVFQLRVSPDLVLKLFPDVLLFYAYIYANAIAGLSLAVFRKSDAARLLGRCDLSARLSNGELLFWLGFVIFVLITFLYWYLVHGWEGNPIEAVTTAERFSRTVAQVALSMMGLMILPISRNNLWSHVFGLSWEAMVKFHRVVSRAFLITVLIHMFGFWYTFSERNVFPQAIFGSPNGFITDNETISMMSVYVLFFALPIMGLLTLNWVRRQHFELFYFSHFFGAALLGAVLWHAASAWYFLLPGLALYAVDHGMRLTKSCRALSSVSLRALGGGVTEVSFVQADGQPLRCEAGQFVFLHIPAVALLEFHPFTLSSSPLDARSTCHIKALGAGQWTDKLHKLAAAAASSTGAVTDVVVDGPYGLPPDVLSRHSTVLLVAGGIGFTPLHALLRTLALQAQAQTSAASGSGSAAVALAQAQAQTRSLRRVRLLWVVRDRALVGAFRDTLERVVVLQAATAGAAAAAASAKQGRAGAGAGGLIDQHDAAATAAGGGAGIIFDLEVFCSAAPSSEQGAAAVEEGGVKGLRLSSGRPRIKAEVEALAAADGRAPLVYCCGPEAMVSEAAAAAREFGVAFHSETFLL